MRTSHTAKKDPWYHSALYIVWRDMMKTARYLYNRNVRFKLSDEFPVDPTFREFDTFRLWACMSQGYKMGEMDKYRIERKNVAHGFTPDNCYFTIEPPKYIEPVEITQGASKVEYKSTYRLKKRRQSSVGGLSNTRLYQIWKGMVRRCTDPNQKDYPAYGARGITVCDEWKYDFLIFWDWAWEHGYSPELSIDRIDVNGNYCPENCRWAGFLEQKLNTRAYDGKYTNVRLNVKRMRDLLDGMRGDVVVTMIVRSQYLPGAVSIEDQDDYPPVPIDERFDVERERGA